MEVLEKKNHIEKESCGERQCEFRLWERVREGERCEVERESSYEAPSVITITGDELVSGGGGGGMVVTGVDGTGDLLPTESMEVGGRGGDVFGFFKYILGKWNS